MSRRHRRARAARDPIAVLRRLALDAYKRKTPGHLAARVAVLELERERRLAKRTAHRRMMERADAMEARRAARLQLQLLASMVDGGALDAGLHPSMDGLRWPA